MSNIAEILERTFNTESGMSNFDIDSVLGGFAPYYAGCYPKDKISLSRVGKNWCMVINMSNDKSSGGTVLPGTHWTAIGSQDGIPWYFDSYGLPPPIEVYRCFGMRTVTYSVRQIQERGTTNCGWYCILFIMSLYNRTLSSVFEPFVNQFDRVNLIDNDQILYKLLNVSLRRYR